MCSTCTVHIAGPWSRVRCGVSDIISLIRVGYQTVHWCGIQPGIWKRILFEYDCNGFTISYTVKKMQINKSSLGYYYHLKSGLLPVGWNNYESLGNLQQASRAAPAGCFTALLQCNTVPREQNLNQLLILIDINCRKQFARFDGSFFF